MRNFWILCGISLSLCGCATLMEVGTQLCDREFESRAALHLALEHASEIPDSHTREAALVAIRASLAVLDRCPNAR